jgi:hypothetical protein
MGPFQLSAVSGNGATTGQLAAVPASVAFGNVTVGSAQSQTVTLRHEGNHLAGHRRRLGREPQRLPRTLVAGQSSAFQVTFVPASAGAVEARCGIVLSSTAPAFFCCLTS